MTKQRKIEVAEHIMSCLDKGMNLGIQDPEKLEVIKAAMSAFFCIDQYRWERDVALDQLKQLGLGLGQIIDGVYIPKEKIPEKQSYHPGISEYYEGFVDGWNDCLEKILEE